MTADAPTILATSGGIGPGRRTRFAFTAMTDFAVELAGAGGTTDSFGPQLQPVTNGLGFVPYANGVHYDSEDQRRPLLHELVGRGALPATYATDDGAGLLYRGTEFVEAVAENDNAGAYFVEQSNGVARESVLDVRRL